MIRKANMNDLEKIMKIIKATVEEMKDYNNTQWDENYPSDKDFVSDIKKQDLYVDEIDGDVAGFICLNYEEPEEYVDLNWSSNKKAMVIHRMAVNPSFRKKGIASKLVDFAEKLAEENSVSYLKSDTYSINSKMNAFLTKCGFIKIGEMSFLGKEKSFYCYDKIL
ncbi:MULTISPECIES: GNAT family N-acetyltransferase [unclassified Clostridioides]|uniref:GNAT family N-acetyltransferase n=1 Tax=unclassified Clostridioides TaxID=2635829 RepID=UPI0006BC02F7|nr:acetyltransferase [Clostridioides difficile]MCC0692581.1 GNAT family N-acetyltransferase [Clostridioides sp. ZZV14-6387]MCI9977167.1 GNAT family N-acetyltransferase [Clostridioides difficile]MDB3083817.1 N-acetyltransferase [Clostridioides difficile]MDI7816123.1 GNAT family N-acetyltransferase [Clostridioides difficile]